MTKLEIILITVSLSLLAINIILGVLFYKLKKYCLKLMARCGELMLKIIIPTQTIENPFKEFYNDNK